jgi:site-specific DNA recombinase
VSRPAALYARVSTEDQAQRYGLDSQVHELRVLAERKGYQIVSEFVDDGVSGATLDRPALTRLRDNLKLFQVVLVHAPDRLSRNLVHQLLLMEEFKKAQVVVEFLTTPTEDTAEGRLLLNIQGVIGEFEREKIKERTLRGKREKARRGLVVTPGNAPYGYRPDPARPGHLMIYEPEAEIVKMIYRLCIDEGKSLDRIVAELHRLGTPSTKVAQGRQWGRTQVARILNSHRYAGTMSYGEEQCLPGGKRQPGSNPITIAIPAIVTPERQAAARAQLTKNKAVLVGRARNFSYMLTGIIRCIVCNARYESVPNAGRRYYRHQATPTCRGPWLSADKAEQAVWDAIAKALKNPKILRQAALGHEESSGARDVEIQSRAEHLRSQIRKIQGQEKSLVDLFLADDLAPTEQARVKLKEFAGERGRLAEALRKAEEQVATHTLLSRGPDVEALCEQARRGLDQLDEEGRRGLLQDLGTEIKVRPDRTLEIHGFLPAVELPPPCSKKVCPTRLSPLERGQGEEPRSAGAPAPRRAGSAATRRR